MRRVALALVVAALAGACAESAIPRATAVDLQEQVATIRSVVEDGRVFAARQRLERLAAVVTRLREGEKLDEGTALEILSAIDDVEAALGLAARRSPDPEPTTPPPPPPDDAEDEDVEEDPGNGHGNDEDKEKDKGGGHGDEGHGNDD